MSNMLNELGYIIPKLAAIKTSAQEFKAKLKNLSNEEKIEIGKRDFGAFPCDPFDEYPDGARFLFCSYGYDADCDCMVTQDWLYYPSLEDRETEINLRNAWKGICEVLSMC